VTATASTPTRSRRVASAGGPAERRPVAHAPLAAERAVHRNSVHIQLPVIGTVHLPAKEDLVFIGGVLGLAAVGLLEWPVALLLGAGHTLATQGHNRLVRQFGEALEEA